MAIAVTLCKWFSEARSEVTQPRPIEHFWFVSLDIPGDIHSSLIKSGLRHFQII